MIRLFKNRDIAGGLFVTAILIFTGTAHALLTGGGREPVTDRGWPEGVVAVANVPSRFGYTESDYHFVATSTQTIFFYKGDDKAFQQVMDALARVRTPAVELVIHDAPPREWISRIMPPVATDRVDWTFTVWTPEGWHAIHSPNVFDLGDRQDQRPVDPPRIDVYLTSLAPADGVDWSKVKVPREIRVVDERISSQKVHPEAGAMVRGVIYDMATGKTIKDAIVEAQRSTGSNTWDSGLKGQSDERGQFQVEAIPPGTYRFVVSARRYAPRAIQAQTELRVGTFKEFDCELSAAIAVKGTVTDDKGKPLPDIRVTVGSATGIDGREYALPQKNQIQTDADGHFTFMDMPTGRALFKCYSLDYRQLERNTSQIVQSWKTARSSSQEPRLTGEAPVLLRMAVPGKIHAKLLSGRWVSISDAEGGYLMGLGKLNFSQDTGTGGSAEFTDLPPGRYFVAAAARVDEDPNAKIVTVTAGQTTEVEIGGK